MIARTLKALESSDKVNQIIPVVQQDDQATVIKIVEDFHITKIAFIAPGGLERQDSIYNALSLIADAEWALVHDGARPFVTIELIDSLFDAIYDVDGVIPGAPLRDTIKLIDKARLVKATLDRSELVAVQTPQLFRFHTLKNAYTTAYQQGYYGTDDAGLVERIGGKIKVIEGSYNNIKITVPQDYQLGEWILKGAS